MSSTPPQTGLLPQTGLMIMFGYTLFNLYNILILQIDFPFSVVWLTAACTVFAVYRFHSFFQSKQGFLQSEKLGFLLVALSFAAIALQYLNLREFSGEDGIQALTNLRTEWVLSMLWLFAGGAVAISNMKDSPPLAITVLVLTCAAFLNGIDDQFMVSYADISSAELVDNISHLSMEKHVVFLLILAYSLSPKTKWFVVAAGMFILFSMGGRTSLFVFAVCVVGMNVGRKSIMNIIYLGIIGLLVIFTLRYAVLNNHLDIDDQRIAKMLFIGGVDEDSSFLARQELLSTNLQHLDEQFLYGDPTIIPQTTGSSRGYIHNILNVWQYYGFFVFSCVVIILLFSLRRMFVLKSNNPTPKIIFGSFFLMYVTLSAILSKSANWDLLWFTLGFWTLLPISKIKRRRRIRHASH